MLDRLLDWPGSKRTAVTNLSKFLKDNQVWGQMECDYLARHVLEIWATFLWTWWRVSEDDDTHSDWIWIKEKAADWGSLYTLIGVIGDKVLTLYTQTDPPDPENDIHSDTLKPWESVYFIPLPYEESGKLVASTEERAEALLPANTPPNR